MSSWSDRVVGHRFRGPDGTFVCTAYAPRSGFWMLPEDPSDKPERIVEMRRAGLASMGICERCGDAGKTDGCAAYAVSVDPPVRSG